MATIKTKQFNRKETVQTAPIPGKTQIQNNAGGFVFEVDDWVKLDRFLILGSEGGSYYVQEKDITKQAHDSIIKCIKKDGIKTVNRIVEISDEGRAPKNDPALFALALVFAHGDAEAKKAAEIALPKVARIGTHLFHFVEYANAFRGWGRSLKRAVANWYTQRPAEALAFQAIKYQGRDGWRNSDLLRLSHPVAPSREHDAIFRWMVKGNEGLGKRSVDRNKVITDYKKVGNLPEIIEAFEKAKVATDKKEIVKLISQYNLPREAIPTQFLNDIEVWEALLPEMKLNALVRNLGKLTSIGIIKPLSVGSKIISASIVDKENIKKSRLHPLSILTALKTYSQGHGDKGSLTWNPNQNIVDALNEAFYLSFKNVEPSGKNVMLCLDISGSMGSLIAGSSLTCRDASAAMALVTANVETNYHIMGFGTSFMPLNISPKMRLDDVVKKISGLDFTSTDCSQPMIYAETKGLDVDAFVVFTDNETYAGSIHPSQALKRYRTKSGRNSRSVVVGMAVNDFTIADPADSGMLDVCGFDTSVPAVISDFIKG